jgi:hypothetical protein
MGRKVTQYHFCPDYISKKFKNQAPIFVFGCFFFGARRGEALAKPGAVPARQGKGVGAAGAGEGA